MNVSAKLVTFLLYGTVLFGGWKMLMPPDATQHDDLVPLGNWQADDHEKHPLFASAGSTSYTTRPLPESLEDPESLKTVAPTAESTAIAEENRVSSSVEKPGMNPELPNAAMRVSPPANIRPAYSIRSLPEVVDLEPEMRNAMAQSSMATFAPQDYKVKPMPEPVVNNKAIVAAAMPAINQVNESPALDMMSFSQDRPASSPQNKPITNRIDESRSSPFQTSPVRSPNATITAPVTETPMVPTLNEIGTSRMTNPSPVTPEALRQDSRPPVTTGPQAVSPGRPPALIASAVVEQRALEHLEYGRSLARRGATFAAREEFIQALRLIAESYDMQSQTRDYTAQLADGLRALNEADDFVMVNAERQLNIDVAEVVATHDSKVLSKSAVGNMSPISAMQMYFHYSTEKITGAVGQSMAAAEVLHAMGKLLQTSSQYDATGKPMDRAKAMVMFQVALSADPTDYRSANELGVLLAQNGKWELAKELFAKSLTINQSPESWMNLARAHEQLGEREHARQANAEYERMAATPRGSTSMEWVSAQQFESDGLMSEATIAPEVPKTARQEPVESDSQGNNIFGRLKKLF